MAEGSTTLPTDSNGVTEWGLYDGTNFYHPRLDNITAKNLRVALYDSLGNPLLVADDAAFTPGTSRVVPIGAFADESATDSVDEGDIGAIRMTPNRVLRVQPTLHSGASGGVATVDQRANYEIAAANFIPSSAGTAPRTGTTITNYNHRCVLVTINVTAVAVNGALRYLLRNALNDQQILDVTTSTLTGATSWSFAVGRGLVLPAAGQVAAVASVPVPHRFYVQLIPQGSLSLTVNAEAVMLV